MKSINVQFEDADWAQLKKRQAHTRMTWSEYIIAASKALEHYQRCADDGK